MRSDRVFGLVIGLFLLAGKLVPPVDVITSQHLAAIGGAPALRAMSTWRMTGSSTMPDGTTWRFTSEHKRPNLCRWESVGPNGSRLRGYNGKTAWRKYNNGPVEILTGEAAQDQIESCEFDDDPLLDYASRGITVSSKGVVALDGVEAYKVETINRSGGIRTMYIDTGTGLEVRRDYMDPDGTVTRQHLSAHRVVSGITTATTWVMTDADGGSPMRSHAEDFSINSDMPAQRFDPPPAE